MKIKRLLVINVPIKNCNLKCEYCYISALKENEKGAAKFLYTPEHVGKCLSKERLGGTCIINLTGGGETLIPKEMPQYIYQLLLQGHFLEVVTNGTLTSRFDEIAEFPRNLLEHAFLTLGVIPELETPTYADIRNRVCEDGREWLSKEVKDAFSQKLADNNEVWDEEKKNSYERKYPFIFFKTALYDWKEIYNKVIRKHKK